ncbi:MAG TPA: hypothetical protein ENN69_01500 [Spirochaetia bacterium]|mgnify:CR=1 FL=1|nr:hypothetical protein [Spirochaetia bacterium]
MKSLTRKIVILISISSILSGIILFLFQLDFIPKDFDLLLGVLLKFWPVTLIIAGFIFLWNSFSRRRYLIHYAAVEKVVPLSYPDKLYELAVEVTYTSGDLSVKAAPDNQAALHYQQFGPMPDPFIDQQQSGNTARLKIQKAKKYFTAASGIRTLWKLYLTKSLKHSLTFLLQDADCSLDLRELMVSELSIKAGSGVHTVHVPPPAEKFSGDIYSASERLELILPEEAFIRVNLRNPFCKIDFPQGDLIRNEDGTIITNNKNSPHKLVELIIDGPLKQLFIDII